MDTDSFYLTEYNLCDCIRRALKKVWISLGSGDCTDEFSANSTTNFFPCTCCAKHNRHDRREPALLKEEFRCTDMICLCSKTYCCMSLNQTKSKAGAKARIKERVKTVVLAPCRCMAKSWKMLFL